MMHPGLLLTTAHQPEVLQCHMDLQTVYLMEAHSRRQTAGIRHRLEVETWFTDGHVGLLCNEIIHLS